MNTAAVSPIPANYAALTRIDMLTGLMDKTSNDYRHACEVRWVISLGSMQAMKAYMDRVQLRRGQAAADRLRDDVRAEIKRQRDDSKK